MHISNCVSYVCSSDLAGTEMFCECLLFFVAESDARKHHDALSLDQFDALRPKRLVENVGAINMDDGANGRFDRFGFQIHDGISSHAMWCRKRPARGGGRLLTERLWPGLCPNAAHYTSIVPAPEYNDALNLPPHAHHSAFPRCSHRSF